MIYSISQRWSFICDKNDKDIEWIIHHFAIANWFSYNANYEISFNLEVIKKQIMLIDEDSFKNLEEVIRRVFRY